MPHTGKRSEQDRSFLVSNGGVSHETVQRRKRILDEFKTFLVHDGFDAEEVLHDGEKLENAALDFLIGYQVQSKKDPNVMIHPKGQYFQTLKSNFKCVILEETGMDLGKCKLRQVGAFNALTLCSPIFSYEAI